ncbi:MAG: hypothetical protein V3V12_03535 [Gammaproteobacteria bacterium]
MKKPLMLVLVLGMLFGGFWYSRQSARVPSEPVNGLPWQIEQLAGGYTRVFGLTPGRDSIQTAIKVLGDDYKLAIIVNDRQAPGLELFYSRFVAGVFRGKLILGTDIKADRMMALIEAATKFKYMENGSRKYQISKNDLDFVYQQIVTSLTFIPGVALDNENVVNRFGRPAETLKDSAGNLHLLYPEKGLDVVIIEKGKDILQYVMPGDFSKLKIPLTER